MAVKRSSGSRAAPEDEEAAAAISACDAATYRSSDTTGTSYLRGVQAFGVKPVEYAVIDGKGFFEGDILLGTVAELDDLRIEVESEAAAIGADGEVGLELSVSGAPTEDGMSARGIGITGQRFRWPGGLVPFTVVPELRNRVNDAIAHWTANTRIRFVERTAANQAQFPNFVAFTVQDGCWSQVGMRGNRQEISLAAGCGLGAAIHEIGHAVGLWHEQSREDRDRHVRINWANIEPGREHNFNQHITDGDDIGNYDFGAIMHYPRTAFSRNGQPTIEPLGGQAIGQRTGLSAGDIAAVRAMYPQLEPSGKWSGVQYRTTLQANASLTFFTHSWPGFWFVEWTVVPTAPPIDGPAQVEWKVRTTRQTDRLLKYFVTIKNLQNYPLSVEARYDVLGWSRNYA
ncbi:MAG: M12 family metallopeptidase [Microbacterium sp.]